jgi:hypothetical protein
MALVSFRHPDGIQETTRITERIASAGTTLTVKNTEGLSALDYIVLGQIGSEKTEIVKITTVDSNTQLTIGATKFAHSVDDVVSYTPYNQIRFASATTIAGTKTQQGAATDLEVDDLVTEVNLTSVTSGYVFARYYNSTTGDYSGYSPAVPVAGFSEDSLRHIIDMARLRTQEKTEKLLTDDDLLNIAKECSDVVETARKKWGFAQKSYTFDMTCGVQSYAAPSTLDGPESIERIFLGIDNTELDYIDNKDFWYEMRSIPKTITTAQIISGATTISVKDTSAFSTSGTLSMNGDSSIPYTGKGYRTFTGVTGVTATYTSNTEVFIASDLDQPGKYTWWNNHILTFPVADKFYGANMEYYQTIPRMTDVSIETIVPMPSMFIWYLMAEIFDLQGSAERSNKYMSRFGNMLKLLSKKNRNKQIIKMSPAKKYFKGSADYDDASTTEREHGD